VKFTGHRLSSRPIHIWWGASTAIFAVLVTLLVFPAASLTATDAVRVVTIQSALLDHPLAPGGSSRLIVSASILPGWHINSDHPSGEYYIPTQLTVKVPPVAAAGPVTYPSAREVSLKFAAGEKLSVFNGNIQFAVPIKADAAFQADVGAPATVRIDYQACNDDQCMRPTSVDYKTDLASSGVPARPSDENGAASADDQSGGGSSWSVAHVFARYGNVLGFLVVLLGGLALNLTPCVYPLIGVTVAYFGNEGGGSRRVITLAILYVLGIALTFSAVGVVAALSGGLFGGALQNPWILVAIATMLLALAASSFGLFVLQPPQWLMQRAGIARPGYVGAVAMGLGMGVVATPCIGPIVLGLLLMVQQSGSALFGFALFFTLAVGLGLPYIALALAAGSIRRLPRSGEWLAWIEQLFGFVLIGLALYFLDPVVPNRVITRLLPYYAIAVGIFLGFISPHGRHWRPFFVLKSAIGSVSVVALAYLLLVGGKTRDQVTFQPFNPASLETAKTQGEPVVLDFSADWCVPCREMERTTFVDPAVVREARGFVRMRANLTAENAHNDQLMHEFNVEGVPTTVFIDATGKIRKRRVGYVGPAEFLRYLREYGARSASLTQTRQVRLGTCHIENSAARRAGTALVRSHICVSELLDYRRVQSTKSRCYHGTARHIQRHQCVNIRGATFVNKQSFKTALDYAR
jgi:thioredoxin:protein disulfide reductase